MAKSPLELNGHAVRADASARSGGTREQGEDLTEALAALLAASIARVPEPQRQSERNAAAIPSVDASVLVSRQLLAAALPQLHGEPMPMPAAGRAMLPPGTTGEMQFLDVYDEDDALMPIPSTWREPPVAADDGWWRQQMWAAVIGLAVGLAVVIPAVVYIGSLRGTDSKTTVAAVRADATAPVERMLLQPRVSTAAVTMPEPAVKPEPVTLTSPPPSLQTPPAVTPTVDIPTPPLPQAPVTSSIDFRPEPPAIAAAPPVRSQGEEILAIAARRISTGDIKGAREILLSAEVEGLGPAVFALAETYDPNMLAAWGTRGLSSDAVRARALYRKALGLGVAHAQTRLDALK
ncbi:MAG: hypothetical protein AB7K67_12065 [Hyphomicrobiaceae bacterium]